MLETVFEIASMVYYVVWTVLTIVDFCVRRNP